MNNSYTIQELKNAILSTGIKSGDTLYLHVSLGFLGKMIGVDLDIREMSIEVINAFLEILGKKGNLIIIEELEIFLLLAIPVKSP